MRDPLDPQNEPDEYPCPGEDCGEPIMAGMSECPNCGQQLTEQDFEPPEPDFDGLPGGADYY